MPTVTDEYGRKKEISREEFLKMLAKAEPGGITIQEVTTDIYTGQQTVRNIPVFEDNSFELYGMRLRFDNPYPDEETKDQKKKRKMQEKRETKNTGAARKRRERQEQAEEAREYARLKEEERIQARRKEEEKRIQAQREEEARKERERYAEKLRSRVPEELAKVRQGVEDRYGYARRRDNLHTMQENFPIIEKRREEQKVRLQAELETIMLLRDGDSAYQTRKDTLRKEYLTLVQEREALQKASAQLGWLGFIRKKQIRERIERIDLDLYTAKGQIQKRMAELDAQTRQDRLQLLQEQRIVDSLRVSVDQAIAWQEKAIHVFMEEYPQHWECYERDLRPIMEYLDSHGPATIVDIIANHPRKAELTNQAVTSFFRLEGFTQFCTREMIRGQVYFSLKK